MGKGIQAKAKAYRAAGPSTSSTSSSSASSSTAAVIRRCALSEKTLEKYGQAYLRFYEWLKTNESDLVLKEFDSTTMGYGDIYELVDLTKVDSDVIDGYLDHLNQPMKSGKRQGLLPTYSVCQNFWSSLVYGYSQHPGIERPASIVADWTEYRKGYRATLATANENAATVIHRGCVSTGVEGYNFIVDRAVDPQYTTPPQMLFAPTMACLTRNTTWRLANTARFSQHNTQMAGDQMTSHVWTGKTDREGVKQHVCHIASNWQDPRSNVFFWLSLVLVCKLEVSGKFLLGDGFTVCIRFG